MERRLQKGFQIGFVEGTVTELIGANKEPQNVFSKIAEAIGHRTRSQSKKKDWNAMVRCNTIARDPIGSSREAEFRQSRQSIKQHSTANSTALLSMDTEKLVEYNPKLSSVTPATRVAYAKFKGAKLRQEFNEINNKADEDATENSGDTSVTDDAFHIREDYNCHPKNGNSQTDATKSTTTARPRKESESLCVCKPSSTANDQLLPESVSELTETMPENTSNSLVNDETPTSQALSTNVSSVKKDFRTRTPIQEQEEQENIKDSQWWTQKEEEKKEADSSKEVKGDTLEPITTVKTTTLMKSPMKPRGKSKITGEITTGWI
jgi:transient receptor potential cation channel subfamily C